MLSCVTVSPFAAGATDIVSPFAVQIDTGGLAGQHFFGSVDFSDTLLPPAGTAVILPDDFELQFDFLGETFSEEDDFDFTGPGSSFPEVQIDPAGRVIGLSYVVDTLTVPGSSLDALFGFIPSIGSIGDQFFYDLFDDTGVIIDSGEGRLLAIPLPATIGILALGLAGLLLSRRRAVV